MNPSDEGANLLSVALQNSKSILVARQRAEQEFLLSVLASSVDAIVTSDDRGCMVSFNRQAERMFGYSADEALGQPFTVLLPEPHRAEYDALFATPQGADVIGREVTGRRKDGSTFPADLGLSEFVLHDRRHVNAVLRDITERKKLEERLRQAQKMEAIGQLAGGVAHDFNNLLTVIGGYGELLLQRLEPADPRRELLAVMMQASERAATLTRQLLAFGRKQILEPKVVNLNDVVGGISEMIRRLIGEDIRLTSALDPTLCAVRVDPNQLEQVLLNLSVNARDAMPGGGRLTFETRNADLDEHFCHQNDGCRPGRYVKLSVTDTGCGMTGDVLSHVFEPFFTTKATGKGTGLGLAMVYGTIKQSGGYVAVQSEPGAGTSFHIYLPHAPEAPPKAAPARPPQLPGGTETVLLVEDESCVRMLAERILRACGYAVLAAADGPEALRAVAGHPTPIHLLVTDVVMPGMSGREVADAVRALAPGVRVLFVSGYTGDDVVRRGIVQAETPFLQKPFSAGQFAQKVREVLDAPA